MIVLKEIEDYIFIQYLPCKRVGIYLYLILIIILSDRYHC